jgi:hypothetical protein
MGGPPLDVSFPVLMHENHSSAASKHVCMFFRVCFHDLTPFSKACGGASRRIRSLSIEASLCTFSEVQSHEKFASSSPHCVVLNPAALAIAIIFAVLTVNPSLCFPHSQSCPCRPLANYPSSLRNIFNRLFSLKRRNPFARCSVNALKFALFAISGPSCEAVPWTCPGCLFMFW